ncbi:MAG: beta family protein [Dehalococcoidia bacterium]
MTINYVPILLTKKGELSALNDLSDDVKARFTPLFTVQPIPYDYDNDTSKAVDQHVLGLGKKIATAWGIRRAFLDPIFLRNEFLQPGAPEPMETLLSDAAAEGLLLTPVVAPGQSPEYTALATAWHSANRTGICVRLTSEQWPISPPRAYALDSLLDALAVEPADIDLVLDLGAAVTNGLAVETVIMTLQALPHASEWKTVTLAGGAFPENLTNMDRTRLNRVPRTEWATFTQVCTEARAAGARIPDFGDYGIAHPDPAVSEVNPAFMQISAQQRYTIDGHWLVAKGELFKGRAGTGVGGAATFPLARMIAAASEFCGADYSPGDAWIASTAEGVGTGGSPLTWRRHGTSHHITFVTGSLAIPDEPSAGS